MASSRPARDAGPWRRRLALRLVVTAALAAFGWLLGTLLASTASAAPAVAQPASPEPAGAEPAAAAPVAAAPVAAEPLVAEPLVAEPAQPGRGQADEKPLAPLPTAEPHKLAKKEPAGKELTAEPADAGHVFLASTLSANTLSADLLGGVAQVTSAGTEPVGNAAGSLVDNLLGGSAAHSAVIGLPGLPPVDLPGIVLPSNSAPEAGQDVTLPGLPAENPQVGAVTEVGQTVQDVAQTATDAVKDTVKDAVKNVTQPAADPTASMPSLPAPGEATAAEPSVARAPADVSMPSAGPKASRAGTAPTRVVGFEVTTDAPQRPPLPLRQPSGPCAPAGHTVSAFSGNDNGGSGRGLLATLAPYSGLSPPGATGGVFGRLVSSTGRTPGIPVTSPD